MVKMPLAFLESMSAGKPIVANNVDGASDVVIDGETGFLVAPHQPQEMAERILYLLNNENLCSEMGHVAQQRSSYFCTERMVGQIESLYKELHSAAHKRPRQIGGYSVMEDMLTRRNLRRSGQHPSTGGSDKLHNHEKRNREVGF